MTVLDYVYRDDDFMKKVINEARRIAKEENRMLYLTEEEQHECYLYYDEGYNEGIKVGTINERNKIIINLVKLDMSDEFIAKAIGLPLKETSRIIRIITPRE